MFYRVLPGFTGFHKVILGFNGFYRVLEGFRGFYGVLRGFTGFHRVLTCSCNFRFVPIGWSRTAQSCLVLAHFHLFFFHFRSSSFYRVWPIPFASIMCACSYSPDLIQFLSFCKRLFLCLSKFSLVLGVLVSFLFYFYAKCSPKADSLSLGSVAVIFSLMAKQMERMIRFGLEEIHLDTN